MKTIQSIMKNSILVTIVALLFALPSLGFSGDKPQQGLEQKMEQFGDRMNLWGDKMDAWGQKLEISIENGDPIPPMPPIPIGKEDYDYEARPLLGVYIEDMDFEDAYEKHYPYCFGVYVKSVVNGGNSDRAGIHSGDIIMEFDGEKVRFEEHLLQLRASKKIGDTVTIKLFRNEEEIETELTFAAPRAKEDKDDSDWGSTEYKKPHPGFGGGGPNLIMLKTDFADINKILQANGFDGIADGYMPLYGGFGMGNIGNGWFIGGGGYGYESTKKISLDNGARRYEYNVGFGGMSVNKKIALTKNVIVDLGILAGGGEATFELRETDGEYSWDDDFDDDPKYYSSKYRKKFFAYHPTAGLLVKILPWMGIQGSAGYLGAYSFNEEWEDDYFDFTVKGEAPKLLDGLTYSVGIWFGN